jgi:uncharacterized protein YgbK (DUF1537 family)
VLKVAVIADDLTGAADTGIQFRSIVAPVYLVSHADLAHAKFDPQTAALSVYSNTRAVAASLAAARVAATARDLIRLGPKRVYKKIDSCMRGNVGAETDALLEELGLRASFIAPAFPEQGRTTVHDILLVHGVPVAETEMGRDPVRPVNTSRLSDLVATQSRLPVGHVDLDTLRAAGSLLATEVDRLISGGKRHIVIDATVQDHLDAIVDLHLHERPDTLLVGSAGLAHSLAERLSTGTAPEIRSPAAGRGHLLFVCGSSSQHLHLQIDRLVETDDFDRWTLDPALLADAGRHQERAEIVEAIRRRLGASNAVLQIRPPLKGTPKYAADNLLDGLSEIVGEVVQGTPLGGLFLSGGDTATAILNLIGAKAVRLEEEVLSGIVRGTLVDGALAGRSVVTKAGAFGQPDALLQLYRQCFTKE